MLGNVKAFILSISEQCFSHPVGFGQHHGHVDCERTREVAVLKTLGFTRRTILGLFVGEDDRCGVSGGVLGSVAALPHRGRWRFKRAV